MKKISTIVIILLGGAVITTSCKKKDEVTPANTPNTSVTYDTLRYSFNVGTIKSDSTLNTSDSYSYYTSTSSYTLLLSQSIPNYVSIDGNIKAIEFNESQDAFYKIESKKIANDVQIKLYCDYNTYQSNDHTIFGKIFTDSTIYEITINIKLANDITYNVLKKLINGHTNNSATMTSDIGDIWTPLVYEKYISSSVKPVHSFIWYNYIGTSENTGYNPTQVGLLSMTVYNDCNITINLLNDKMTFIVAGYNIIREYKIESVVGSKVYLNDGSNLYWVIL